MLNLIYLESVKNNENNKTGIVLNRMYTGSYLSTNLGHEVINMFQADDKKHYLYLNSKGNFGKNGEEVGTMLFVKYAGEGSVEVVGKAENLNVVQSAHCTLPRDLERINEEVQKLQNDFMKNIYYGGVPIQKIFGGIGQQSIYISYFVEEDNFFLPVKPIFIYFNSENASINKDKVYLKRCFASTSLHQFVLDGEDLVVLNALINNEKYWNVDNTPVDIVELESYVSPKLSLFDICRITENELVFSNAIAFYIEKYPHLFKMLFGIESNIVCVKREYKNIDILIKDGEKLIIIENKIHSAINRKKSDKHNESQLNRYWEELINNEGIDETYIKGFILCPEYAVKKIEEDKKNYKYNDKYTIISYKEIWENLKNTIEVQKDPNFEFFVGALGKHIYESEPKAKYEEMKNTFLTRIKELIEKDQA